MRTIDALTLAEVSKQTGSYPIQLVHFNVSADNSDDLYLNTGYRNVVFDGDTYIAGSNVLGFSPVEETKDVKTNAVTVELNGVPNTIIAALEDVDAIGGVVTIYQGYITPDATNFLDSKNVYEKWQGIINSHSVTQENQETGNVKITVECKNIVGTILNTKSGRYTSLSSFQDANSDDLSMEFVASIVDFNPSFGREE